ncbi:MAG: outer membrane lipoprotein carrier protein LolA, partial [Acetobacteraceae bacterium]|nr:outer membrane lipoprotein carrier protein LolA [Acetobacteraceae bacterium]
MKRRILLGLLPVLLLASAAAAQPRPPQNDRDRADIARIEAYLNSVVSLKARFLQIAPNGA